MSRKVYTDRRLCKSLFTDAFAANSTMSMTYVLNMLWNTATLA